MTPTQVETIRASWVQVEPISDEVASLFYGRLFDLDPMIRRVFRWTDMVQHKKILMQTLAVVVRGLDRFEELVPAIEALGRRHATYGAREAQYDTVGEALLWALREGLGDAFTPDVREAWAEAYYTLASVMIGAASGEAAA